LLPKVRELEEVWSLELKLVGMMHRSFEPGLGSVVSLESRP
jgi:hypothetical protein